MAEEKIILGIDPGTTIMGFGLIKVVNKKMHFLQLNELDLKKYSDQLRRRIFLSAPNPKRPDNSIQPAAGKGTVAVELVFN